MTKLEIEELPKECSYCNNEADVIITKRRFCRRTAVPVCNKCAKKIWNEETNKTLP